MAQAPQPSLRIDVQTAPFDAGAEIEALRRASPATGAVVCFVGQVRDVNEGDEVTALELEHYPGMTEQVIAQLCNAAVARWPLSGIRVIHRTGMLLPLDPIVLVLVASMHRAAAFEACEFIMDDLKTRAPFWKKERTRQGERWVQARASDQQAAQRWR